jgi:hypothetical protein
LTKDLLTWSKHNNPTTSADVKSTNAVTATTAELSPGCQLRKITGRKAKCSAFHCSGSNTNSRPCGILHKDNSLSNLTGLYMLGYEWTRIKFKLIIGRDATFKYI